MINLVAVVGKMHSGKTSFSRAMEKYGYTRFAFADPVKEGSGKMLAALYDYLEIPHEEFGFDWIDANKGHPAIRQLAQLTGDELGRQFIGPDSIWIDRFEKRIKHAQKTAALIINDDCRYPNEAKRLDELGFFIIKLERDEEQRLASIQNALRFKNPELSDDMIGKKMLEMLSHGSETNVDSITPHVTVPSTSVRSLQELAAIIAHHDFEPAPFIKDMDVYWDIFNKLDSLLL